MGLGAACKLFLGIQLQVTVEWIDFEGWIRNQDFSAFRWKYFAGLGKRIIQFWLPDLQLLQRSPKILQNFSYQGLPSLAHDNRLFRIELFSLETKRGLNNANELSRPKTGRSNNMRVYQIGTRKNLVFAWIIERIMMSAQTTNGKTGIVWWNQE
ncbi:unnamed protein product, partial [Ilex paraguariensis]